MRLIEVEYAEGAINQYFGYDERGNPGTVKLAFGEPEERIINYTYHPNINVPLTRKEPSNLGSGDKETIWDYDDDYNTIPNEAPTSLVSRIIEKGFTKDGAGSVVSYEYITTFTYNTKGQVLSIDGPLPGTGDTTFFVYDAVTGDLLSITRPIIGATTFSGYDDAGQVDMVTDVNGQSKSFTYDGRGRVIVITNNADGSSSTVKYVYDGAGNPLSKKDAKDITVNYVYDTINRLINVNFPDAGQNITYSYDAGANGMGRRTGMADESGTISFGYDNRGRLTGKISVINGITYDLSGNYTPGGRRSSVTYPSGRTIDYHRTSCACSVDSITTTYDSNTKTLVNVDSRFIVNEKMSFFENSQTR